MSGRKEKKKERGKATNVRMEERTTYMKGFLKTRKLFLLILENCLYI